MRDEKQGFYTGEFLCYQYMIVLNSESFFFTYAGLNLNISNGNNI